MTEETPKSGGDNAPDTSKDDASAAPDTSDARNKANSDQPLEYGGRGGLEPTRYGDWEVGGIISDF